MQCTALHCSALHCTELSCTALHCTLSWTALHWTAFVVLISTFIEQINHNEQSTPNQTFAHSRCKYTNLVILLLGDKYRVVHQVQECLVQCITVQCFAVQLSKDKFFHMNCWIVELVCCNARSRHCLNHAWGWCTSLDNTGLHWPPQKKNVLNF